MARSPESYDMNVRDLMVGLLACAALQACTTRRTAACAPPAPGRSRAAAHADAHARRPRPRRNATASTTGIRHPTGPRGRSAARSVVDPRGLCDGRDEGERIQTKGPPVNRSPAVFHARRQWLAEFSPNGRR